MRILALILVTLIANTALASDFKFNFRATSGYVTDGAGETYTIGSDDYDVTRDGIVFGWDTAFGIQFRDRTTGQSTKLAGTATRSNNGTQHNFRIDLPSTGEYEIRLAGGDWSDGTSYQYFQFLDDTTVIATVIDTDGHAANTFIDATGVVHSAANWEANNTAITHTFTSTTFFLTIGSPGSEGGDTRLAHIQISSTGGGGGTVILRRRRDND